MTASPAGSMPSRRDRARSMSISIPSSINKTVRVDIPIVGDCAHALEDMIRRVEGAAAPARQAGAEATGGSRSTSGGRATALRYKHAQGRDHAAICDRAALCADPRQGRLHHHRSRPAPDVGGAVLQVRGAEPLDDVGRARHHGLWPAGDDRRADGASRTRSSSTSPAMPRC